MGPFGCQESGRNDIKHYFNYLSLLEKTWTNRTKQNTATESARTHTHTLSLSLSLSLSHTHTHTHIHTQRCFCYGVSVSFGFFTIMILQTLLLSHRQHGKKMIIMILISTRVTTKTPIVKGNEDTLLIFCHQLIRSNIL